MKNLILTLIITLPLTLLGQGWEQTFGGTSSDWGNSIQQTQDGGYIIVGYSDSFGNGDSDVYLIKTDGSGNEQWTKTFGGGEDDRGYSVQQTLEGGYIIIGWTDSFGNGGYDVYLIKTDGNGNEQWSQTWGGENSDQGLSVQQTSDGGYIITGVTNSSVPDGIFLIKTDESGFEEWFQTYYQGVGGNEVQQTIDEGYIIVGTDNVPEVEGIVLIKTDENGIEQWSQTCGGEYTQGSSVQQTTDGGYIILGWTDSFGNGGYDVYLIKTDGNGNEQWTKTFGGGEDDRGYSVQQTSDGGYIITGVTNSFGNGDSDVFLIKTDDQGNITSTFEIPLPNTD